MATELSVRLLVQRAPGAAITSLYEREFWDITRHELVAGAADELLNPQAKEMVRVILEPLGLVGLADVAGWADTVKRRGPQPDDDQETRAFLSDPHNANNDTWHYVNLPAGAAGYDRDRYPTFTRDDDVVQIIGESVRVLLGDSSRFSVTNALRLVTHLVGDVHQPLHVGCSFLLREVHGSARLTLDPDIALQAGWQSDQGGNRLLLPLSNGGVKLHEYWDAALRRGAHHDDDAAPGEGDVVISANGAAPPGGAWFVQKLLRIIEQVPPLDGVGDALAAAPISLDRLAEEWATGSIIAAREAYCSFAIASPHGQHAFDVIWEGKAAYDGRCTSIVERRLAEASQNLAGLINAIWPET